MSDKNDTTNNTNYVYNNNNNVKNYVYNDATNETKMNTNDVKITNINETKMNTNDVKITNINITIHFSFINISNFNIIRVLRRSPIITGG